MGNEVLVGSLRTRNRPQSMELLNQLGGLILGSVPTIVFFLVLVVAYGFLVRRPMDKDPGGAACADEWRGRSRRGARLARLRPRRLFLRTSCGAARREIFEARDRAYEALGRRSGNRCLKKRAKKATADKVKGGQGRVLSRVRTSAKCADRRPER